MSKTNATIIHSANEEELKNRLNSGRRKIPAYKRRLVELISQGGFMFPSNIMGQLFICAYHLILMFSVPFSPQVVKSGSWGKDTKTATLIHDTLQYTWLFSVSNIYTSSSGQFVTWIFEVFIYGMISDAILLEMFTEKEMLFKKVLKKIYMNKYVQWSCYFFIFNIAWTCSTTIKCGLGSAPMISKYYNQDSTGVL